MKKIFSIGLMILGIIPLIYAINHLRNYFKSPVVIDQLGTNYYFIGNLYMTALFILFFLIIYLLAILLLVVKRKKQH